MPILVDISQITIANIMMSPDIQKSVDELLIKHMVINSLRAYNVKFKNKYGAPVICCDSFNVWRKEKFEFYKQKRKKDKEESSLDWKAIYAAINGILHDLKEVFPYKVIKVDGAEADDIIAVLSQAAVEPTLILSSDKDFGQLQNRNVEQFDPRKKKFITHTDTQKQLMELIICGDDSDGIPNILSDSDTFVDETKRQKSIFKEKLDVWVTKTPEEFCENSVILKNFKRNQELIDFRYIPADVKKKILAEYSIEPKGSISQVMQYFTENRMRHLMESLQEF